MSLDSIQEAKRYRRLYMEALERNKVLQDALNVYQERQRIRDERRRAKRIRGRSVDTIIFDDIKENKMKLMICGLARHGKDTAAEYLAARYGLSFQSSSRAALDIFLFDELNRERGWTGLKPYPDKEAAFNDRVNLRPYWHEAIQRYNTPDKARLAKGILAKNDIYVGMRCQTELAAARPMIDWVIWIDASFRLGVTESSDSISIASTDADVILSNNGTLEEFHKQLDEVYQAMLSTGKFRGG